MSERDGDLKAREEGSERAALRETYGRTPGGWMWGPGAPAPPPPGVAVHAEPKKLIEGRGKADPGNVTSVWQVRPVNSFDYTAIYGRGASDSPSVSGGNTLQSAYFRVPGAYVATIERFTYYSIIGTFGVPFDATLANPSSIVDDTLRFGLSSGHVFIEFFFNGSPQGLFSILRPSGQSDWATGMAERLTLPTIGIDVPCFFLAPPDTLIELRHFIGMGPSDLVPISYSFVSFAGVLRETRGNAFNYEVQS